MIEKLCLCLFVLNLGIILSAEGVDWTTITSNIKSKVNQGAEASGHQMIKVKSAVSQKAAAKFKTVVAEEVEKADIRLLLKDPDKSPVTHPLLSSAHIDEKQAKSMFVTGLIDFFTWVNDLESEYKSIGDAEELFSSHHYNSSLNSLLILHDRCGSARDHSVLKIAEALKLRNFDVHYNIFLLDFKNFMCHSVSPKTGSFKLGINPQFQLLATDIANFLYKGIEKDKLRAEQINILGLGVSTHLAGLVARHMWTLSGQKINSILGLDPPLRLRRAILSSEFTENFHIYHTFKRVPGRGFRTGRATADFVFGGGKRRPKCEKSVTSNCFSWFGVQLLVSTLLYPKLFPGRWCPNYHKFSQGFCGVNDYAYVSFPPDKSASGTYQMDINYVFPYGKGLEGIYETKEEAPDAFDGSGEVAKLSVQEYLYRLEMEVTRIRGEMLACINGVMTPTAIMRCVMAAQPSIKRLEKNHFISKINCEPFDKSPTGKKCNYRIRTGNTFELPF